MIGLLLLGALGLSWFLFESWLTLVHSHRDTADRETTTKLVMAVTLLLGVIVPFLFGDVRAAFLSTDFGAMRTLGILVIGTGLAVRAAAVFQLGDSFDADPQVRPGQQLFEGGLYGWIRHPGYLGDVLGFAGFALALGHGAAGIFAFSVPTLGVLYRIRVEERMLEAAWNGAYVAYRRRTYALVPWIW